MSLFPYTKIENQHTFWYSNFLKTYFYLNVYLQFSTDSFIGFELVYLFFNKLSELYFTFINSLKRYSV